MSKILIIEDEKEIADLEKDYLEMNDLEVEICDRGDTGLEAALNNDYNLIILDVMLPGVDGFDICRKVRAEKNIPIIMLPSISALWVPAPGSRRTVPSKSAA